MSADAQRDSLRITAHLAIPESELVEEFIRSSGPGGQNVNKVATAVELRFDVRNSPSLPGPARHRLERLAGRRLTKEGVLVLRADRFRTQDMNRSDARERLAMLVREALIEPKKRIKTRPSLASKRRRLDSKSRRGDVKRQRSGKPSFD